MAAQCVMNRPLVSSARNVAPRGCRPKIVASAAPTDISERISRRAAAGLLVAIPTLFTASAALAKDDVPESPAAQRKAALRATAEAIKKTGEDKSAFAESGYAVSEDKSPNVHTRQEEGMRKSN